jgi:hypothetical protein
MRDELPERYFYTKNRVVKIGQVLKAAFPKRGSLEKTCQHLKEIWKQVVDDDVYRSTAITGFKRGILYVNVESSVMIHYLTNFKRNAIVVKMNKTIGTKYIEDIRFKIGVL